MFWSIKINVLWTKVQAIEKYLNDRLDKLSAFKKIFLDKILDLFKPL